ncbi:MAG TPA: putative toxin-antitoxin system toxin component, PIN family [Polyangia bacterium]|nr:putative toxin-antitoxin system toxin component, PIN family [Polyangia bacterium]
MIRTVIDANVWISAFLKPDSAPGVVVRAWQRHAVEVHVATVTVSEVARALARPRLAAKYQVRWSEVTRFVGDLVAGTTVHQVVDPPRRCRDQTDDALLELAIRLAPSTLVTGDRDLLDDPALLESMRVSAVEVVTPAVFSKRVAGGGPGRPE